MYSRRAPTRHHCPLFATLGIAVVSGSFGLVLWLGIRGVLRGVAGQPLFDLRDGCHKALSAEGTFPDDRDPPARLKQLLAMSLVACDVPGKLCLPEIRACRRGGGILAARMTVPEAAVDKADSAMLGKDQIRPSGQPLVMQSVAESARMQRLAQRQLWPGILAPDASHHSRPCRLVNDVRHGCGLLDSSHSRDHAGRKA